MTTVPTPETSRKVSRRAAIKSMASGTAAVAVGALATTATALTTADDPIPALYERWRALIDECGALCVQYDEIEQTIPWHLRIERGEYGRRWPDVSDLPEFTNVVRRALIDPALRTCAT